MFVPNRNFEKEMAADASVRKSLMEAVEPAREQAEQFAAEARIMPRGSQAIVVGEDDEGVYLANTDYGGHMAEWGSVNSPPYAPLRRGVEAAGLELRDADES